ncbi:MAG: PKD domain-containing protein [Mucispirillum sp.]|nr:PKD domain-containing protein [Mucispirillum sp.]
MKKTKILFILLLSLSSLFIACDKGEDSVDFTYSQDSKDPRIFYFQASGSSDYGDFDYRWDFGKGNTSSGSNASHQFDDYGNHVVTLYADIDKSGIHSTVSKKIEIDIPKITNVDFSYTTSSTNPKEYYFIATGKSNYGTVDFEWDFGQNNIETGERATYKGMR